jgi:flavin-dependent dehydrogenase
MPHSRADAVDAADVVVVGAGPAGAVAATLLARQGVRVVLQDRERHPVQALGEVLPPAARLTFDRLGLGRLLDEDAHLPSPGTVSAWGADTPRETDFLFSPYGPGLHLDRARFDARLREIAVAAGARVRQETWGVSRPDGAPRTDPPARSILDCTGRVAAVMRSRGATWQKLDMLVAISGLLAPGPGSPDVDARTFVASVAGGWWYSALLPGGRRIATFQTDADLLPRPVARDPGTWFACLVDVPVIGSIVRDTGARPPPSLRVSAADSRRLVSPRYRPAAAAPASISNDPPAIAAGDAAMAFDPLSSQGILSAVQSAEDAVDVVLAILSGDERAVMAASARRADADRGRWSRYVTRLDEAYRDEQRWHAAPFWARRHARISTSSADGPGSRP